MKDFSEYSDAELFDMLESRNETLDRARYIGATDAGDRIEQSIYDIEDELEKRDAQDS